MIGILARVAVNAIALIIIAQCSAGQIEVKGWGAAFISAIVLGLLNALVKPIVTIIAELLTLPLSCITLGLWNLVLSWLLNALMFYWAAGLLGGFNVKSFWVAMLGALALSVVNAFVSVFVNDKKERKRER